MGARRRLYPGGGLPAISLVALLLCAPGLSPAMQEGTPAPPTILNGFALTPSSIPPDAILPGGPPRDAIPALTDPKLLPGTEAPYADSELMIGVMHGGEARAYPIAILNWHELVNDQLGGSAILVSFCPLCGTALVFDRSLGGRPRTFGVSGLLFDSDLLLYDRETESLWSQISATAVTGSELGKRLRVLRSSLVPWGAWREKHPASTVLSPDTGHQRDYQSSPYAEYAKTDGLMFPVRHKDPRYHAKMPTIGLRLAGGAARAYPAEEIAAAGGQVSEEFEGRPVIVRYDTEEQLFSVEAPDDVEVIEGYWFAWAAFHPQGSVFRVAKP